jgi:hypothetical protein
LNMFQKSLAGEVREPTKCKNLHPRQISPRLKILKCKAKNCSLKLKGFGNKKIFRNEKPGGAGLRLKVCVVAHDLRHLNTQRVGLGELNRRTECSADLGTGALSVTIGLCLIFLFSVRS